MRLIVAVGVAVLLVSVPGCGRKGTDEGGGIAPDQRSTTANQETGSEPEEGEARVVPELLGETIEDNPVLGLYSTPDGLPACDISWSLRESNRLTGYADLDGDDVREALVVGIREKKAGGQWDPAVFLHIAQWDEAEKEWTTWHTLRAPEGESRFDENVLGFAYDVDNDGYVELGLQFQHHPEAADDDDALVTNFYVYRTFEGSLDPAAADHMLDSLHGAFVQLEWDEIFIDDFTEDYPGEEIIIASARAYRGETEPFRWSINVNAWMDGKLNYLYKYQTETRYETGDDAYAAWDEGGEDFELITDYTDDEAE